VTKILNFLSEHNVAIPSSRRKLAIKYMLEKLQELKGLEASIPAPSLSSASFQPIIKIFSAHSYLSSLSEGCSADPFC